MALTLCSWNGSDINGFHYPWKLESQPQIASHLCGWFSCKWEKRADIVAVSIVSQVEEYTVCNDAHKSTKTARAAANKGCNLQLLVTVDKGGLPYWTAELGVVKVPLTSRPGTWKFQLERIMEKHHISELLQQRFQKGSARKASEWTVKS